MNLSNSWPLAFLLLALAGCSGSSTSTAGGKSAAELMEIGSAEQARGEFDRAQAHFDAALQLQPDSARAHQRRGELFLQWNKLDQALYDCNEALKIDGKFSAAYFTRGLVKQKMGDAEKALEDFSKALDSGLEQADVLAARGALYYSLAKASTKPDEITMNLQKALQDFDRAIKQDPHKAGLHMQRAAVHLDLGDYENAVADCDAALEVNPNLAAARLGRARGECELGETDKAIADCDAALHLDANLVEANVVRARSRLEKASEMRTVGEVAECSQAVDDCQKAIDKLKNFKGDLESTKHAKAIHGTAHELRGSIYQNLAATKKAMAEYEKALSLDPYLVSALLRRAVARSNVEDYAGALGDCNTAIGVDSTRADAYCGRGTIYLLKRDRAKAIEDFTTAVHLDRKCAKAYAGLARVYLEMATEEHAKAERATSQQEIDLHRAKTKEVRQKAMDYATAAIGANRHLANGYLMRGIAYATQQFRDKAIEDFSAAIREDSRMAVAYSNRGVLHYKSGEWDAAISDFLQATRLRPGLAKFLIQLGESYRRKGELILAADCFKKAHEKLVEVTEDLETGIPFKPKKIPEVQPDSALDPLELAKRNLEKKLDATGEK